MIRSRPEALIVSLGLCLIIIVLGYCAWRIQITQQWLHDHRAYIQERDGRWEEYMRHAQAKQDQILNQIEGHLLRQDGHMGRQDSDFDRVMKNQAIIIEHIHREEAMWKGPKP